MPNEVAEAQGVGTSVGIGAGVIIFILIIIGLVYLRLYVQFRSQTRRIRGELVPNTQRFLQEESYAGEEHGERASRREKGGSECRCNVLRYA